MVDVITTVITSIDPTTGNSTTIPINNWTSYTYDSDFFIPCDGFNFELSDDRFPQTYSQISYGNKIELYINNILQCTGMIDHAHISYSRNSGSILNITGRDLLSIVADTTIAPNIQNQIKPTSTYGSIFDLVFESFNDGTNF